MGPYGNGKLPLVFFGCADFINSLAAQESEVQFWPVPSVLPVVTELSKSPAEADLTHVPWDRLNYLLEEPALEWSQTTSSDQSASLQISEVRGGESQPFYLSSLKTGNGYKQNMLWEGRVWVKNWRGRHNTWVLFLALPQLPFNELCSSGA